MRFYIHTRTHQMDLITRVLPREAARSMLKTNLYRAFCGVGTATVAEAPESRRPGAHRTSAALPVPCNLLARETNFLPREESSRQRE